MGLSGSSALSGLLTAQRALEVVGHNVANASTPGYSRQRVELSTRRPQSATGAGQLGTGVQIVAIRRSVDMFLEGRLQEAESRLGVSASSALGVGELEEIWGRAGQQISDTLTAITNVAEEIAARPDDPILRTQFIGHAEDLARRIRTLASDVIQVRSDLSKVVEADVGEANSLVAEVKALNLEIRGLEISGQTPNDLLDRRAIAVRALGRLVGAESKESPSGEVSLRVAGRILLSGQDAETLSASNDAQGMTQLHVGGLLTTLEGGSVLGSQRAQSAALDSEGRLDTLARGMIEVLNRANSVGVPASGPMTSLASGWPTVDVNGSGSPNDDPLASAGLPFVPGATTIQVNVTDPAGVRTTTAVSFDPATGTLADLASALGASPFLNASADPGGILRLSAVAGYAFDFADPGGDPDPGGLLAALGLGAVLGGDGATDITLVLGSESDLALGWTPAPGDGRNATRIAAALSGVAAQLGDETPVAFLAGIVTRQGLVARRANADEDSSGASLDALEARNQSVSGVSLEEEVADLLKFQQAFEASARYLSVINEISDTLLRLV
ncbi:MAG: flagellar hook-associated protein FlgK [Planctomycetes bacterium]|nr:flagellar hook-associated protein FlgK [Planctomycetota bacterium]